MKTKGKTKVRQQIKQRFKECKLTAVFTNVTIKTKETWNDILKTPKKRKRKINFISMLHAIKITVG